MNQVVDAELLAQVQPPGHVSALPSSALSPQTDIRRVTPSPIRPFGLPRGLLFSLRNLLGASGVFLLLAFNVRWENVLGPT
jgi:hypothetical protein